MELKYEHLKNELLRSLEANKVWVLASSDGERVSARSMSVVHHGLDVYFQTSRGFEKYRQISRNGNVALCCSNVSIEGVAYDLGPWGNVPAMRDLYIQHHRGSYEAYGTLNEQVVIKVVPHYAVFWKYIEGKPARDFLYIAEERAERAFYFAQDEKKERQSRLESIWKSYFTPASAGYFFEEVIMKYVDLSALIEQSPETAAPFERTDIVYHTHAAGAAQAQAILKVPPQVFRHSEGWATEEFTKLGTHNTTHVDAPWHYNSEIQGDRSQTVEELPLEWFFSDGVVLTMTHKSKGNPVTSDDIKAELQRVGYTLKSLDIVLVRTGCDQFYGRPDYIFQGPGVTAEATHWLYDQGVRVMGIDAWGWDEPLDLEAKNALTGQGVFWAAHQADLPYAQIERMVNLGALPSHGFKVACFPLKVKSGSAGPTRAVAILPD